MLKNNSITLNEDWEEGKNFKITQKDKTSITSLILFIKISFSPRKKEYQLVIKNPHTWDMDLATDIWNTPWTLLVASQLVTWETIGNIAVTVIWINSILCQSLYKKYLTGIKVYHEKGRICVEFIHILLKKYLSVASEVPEVLKMPITEHPCGSLTGFFWLSFGWCAFIARSLSAY